MSGRKIGERLYKFSGRELEFSPLPRKLPDFMVASRNRVITGKPRTWGFQRETVFLQVPVGVGGRGGFNQRSLDSCPV